ncbi:hypothetical protein [Microbacterium candidum]|uniref:protein-tyrosine-phosphatase n=1 Tax=Microbacterium candidum TaxID=3041922 RepID=A0ABT7MV17_9MICO|nr:hypothetical protein [Microbacterium sp. ASV49]MDL9978286.1 hypothetical protein [Microbacterium sp. ASV49]
MNEEFRVLVVCTGNVHRSALADELMSTWADWYLPEELRRQVVVGSAGTRAPVGEPMGVMTRRVATSLGVSGGEHTARMLTDDLIESADLVLTASRAHSDEVVRRVPRAMRRTFTIREAGRIAALVPPGHPTYLSYLRSVVAAMADLRHDAAASRPSDDDIVDPQGRGSAGVDAMVREEIPALVLLAQSLWGMPAPDADAYNGAAADPAALR